MNARISQLAAPTLLVVLTLISLSGFAQPTQPSIANFSRGLKAPPLTGLFECGSAHFQASLVWTGYGSEALMTFEDPRANAVCGNRLIDSEKLKMSGLLSDTPLAFYSISSVPSYDNGNLFNITAQFNPGLRRVLRKGRTELLACHNELGQAEIGELHKSGAIALKYRDQRLDEKCGQGRYFNVDKLLRDTIQLQKSGREARQVSYSEYGYLECGTSYYFAKLEHSRTSNDSIAHFINSNAQAMCGHVNYDTKTVSEGRGFMAMQWAKFLPRPKSESVITFLNETRLKRGQIITHAPCKNNLGKAQVVNVVKEYGLVALHFENAQLDALCGQGRYHQTSKVLKARESLMKRISNVRYFAK